MRAFVPPRVEVFQAVNKLLESAINPKLTNHRVLLKKRNRERGKKGKRVSRDKFC